MTTDPSLRSFIEVEPNSHFSIQNLPYGVFRTADRNQPRVGVAIGDQILDLSVLEKAGLIVTGASEVIFAADSLNPFLALGPKAWQSVRAQISALLRHDNPALRDNTALRQTALTPMKGSQMVLPMQVGGYTDFFSSREHALNAVHILVGPDVDLAPNWRQMPVCYNSRASSVVVSDTQVRRPLCQRAPNAAGQPPLFGPSTQLDFELELGSVIGMGNDLGSPISVADADAHVFGMTLLNDWSARDTQLWESTPLGPFNGKIFCTSISPWVVTMEALAPFRVKGPEQTPLPLPYLRQSAAHNINIALEARLTPQGGPETTIARTNFRHMYWSTAQQIAHHTISGCNLRPGDLIGSGTVSGSDAGSFGSLFELAWHGARPISLNGGAQRSYLEDGDTLTLAGWCQGDGYLVGFGSVSGVILPSPLLHSGQ